MAQRPYIKDLLSIANHLADSLSERIPKSGSLQHECKRTAANLRHWRKILPDMEFLLKPTGDKWLYQAILSPLSEMLCILCQLIWTVHELGKAPSLATVSRTNEAEQILHSASAPLKKSQDDLGIWRKPTRTHTPLALLFDTQTSRHDKRFAFLETAVAGHLGACLAALTDLSGKIERARKRHVGLRLLAGKAP